MSDFFDIRHQMEESPLMAQKQYRDEIERKEKIERENASLKLQSDATRELQDFKATFQKQREIDRQERQKEREADYIQRQDERHRDKWFAAVTLIIAAVLGGLVVKLLDVFFK